MKPLIAIINTFMNEKGKFFLRKMEKSSKDPLKSNEKLLLKLLKDNKDTEYGKKYDFANIKSFEEYKEKVPLSTYDTYEPYIERMIKNKETNLITAYKVIQYAETSGSVGVQKKIPITTKSMRIYQKYSYGRTLAMANKHYKKINHKRVPPEKGLSLFETELTVLEDGTPVGSVSGAVASKYRLFFNLYLSSPDEVCFPIKGMDIDYMKARFALEERNLAWIYSSFMTSPIHIINYIKKNWEMICDDIEAGDFNPNVCDENARKIMLKYVKKNPKRANELREIFKEGFDSPIIPKIWPKLSYVCAIGTGSFSTYTDKFKKYAGEEIPIDYFVYAASEGMFAASFAMNDPRYIPLTDSCFFEFLPADAEDNDNNTLTLDQLEEGKEYEVIITNQCGFYRYKIKDVIKVIGFENKCPLIAFSYRKGQLVNACGEKTTEEHLNETVRRFAKTLNVDISDFALYVDNEASKPRYVLLIEPDTPLAIDKDGKYAELFENILCDVNREYNFASKVRHDVGKPLVLIQKQETHALWREYKLKTGSSTNQVKPVRVLDTKIKQDFFLSRIEDGQEF